MKIRVIFCAYDRPGYYASGPNTWIKRLAPDLISMGLDVHTLIIHSGNESECPTITYFKKTGLPASFLSSDHFVYVEDQIKWIIKKTRDFDADILIANLVVPAYYTAYYLKPFGIPVIGVQHSADSFYDVVYNDFLGIDKRRSISALITVSDYLKNRAERYNIQRIPVIRIPCGAPIPQLHCLEPRDNLKIIYVGPIRIVPKQIVKITQAFCKLARENSHLLFSIYGEGPDADAVRRVITDNNAGDNVTYYGPIEPVKIFEVMKEHHVFTLMSDWEGMPISLLEAMSCGLVPVCLSEKSGINEAVRHEYNGLIVRDREDSYCQAIGRLFNDRELWQRLSQNATKTVQEEYSSEINHRKWFDLLVGFGKRQKKNRVKIPLYINVKKIKPFAYGDNRRPSLYERLIKTCINGYAAFRMRVRIRTRIRNAFIKISLFNANEDKRQMRFHLSRIDLNRHYKIKERYAHVAPYPSYSKYLDLEKYLHTAILRAYKLNLNKSRPRKKVLDLGAGAGYFDFVCNNYGHHCITMDMPGIPMYDEIAMLLGIRRISWQIKPFERLPDCGGLFDIITAFSICFNNHDTPQLWGSAEWSFFINDLLAHHLSPGGRIHLEFNKERNGEYFNSELEKFFIAHGASFEDGGIVELTLGSRAVAQ